MHRRDVGGGVDSVQVVAAVAVAAVTRRGVTKGKEATDRFFLCQVELLILKALPPAGRVVIYASRLRLTSGASAGQLHEKLPAFTWDARHCGTSRRGSKHQPAARSQ